MRAPPFSGSATTSFPAQAASLPPSSLSPLHRAEGHGRLQRMPCTPSAPTPLLAQAHEPTPISIPSLPIDVAQIVHFVLFDSFAQSLLNSASNTFFSPRAGKVEIREGTGGCWELLPEQWKDYFEGLERIDVEQRFRDQVWADLAAGKHRVKSRKEATVLLRGVHG